MDHGRSGARLGMLVLHDDAQREFAYGPAASLPESRIGTFTQPVYDEAKKKGWTVISIKNDWKRVLRLNSRGTSPEQGKGEAVFSETFSS